MGSCFFIYIRFFLATRQARTKSCSFFRTCWNIDALPPRRAKFYWANCLRQILGSTQSGNWLRVRRAPREANARRPTSPHYRHEEVPQNRTLDSKLASLVDANRAPVYILGFWELGWCLSEEPSRSGSQFLSKSKGSFFPAIPFIKANTAIVFEARAESKASTFVGFRNRLSSLQQFRTQTL